MVFDIFAGSYRLFQQLEATNLGKLPAFAEQRTALVLFGGQRRMAAAHPIEKVGAELRKMMTWLKK